MKPIFFLALFKIEMFSGNQCWKMEKKPSQENQMHNKWPNRALPHQDSRVFFFSPHQKCSKFLLFSFSITLGRSEGNRFHSRKKRNEKKKKQERKKKKKKNLSCWGDVHFCCSQSSLFLLFGGGLLRVVEDRLLHREFESLLKVQNWKTKQRLTENAINVYFEIIKKNYLFWAKLIHQTHRVLQGTEASSGWTLSPRMKSVKRKWGEHTHPEDKIPFPRTWRLIISILHV